MLFYFLPFFLSHTLSFSLSFDRRQQIRSRFFHNGYAISFCSCLLLFLFSIFFFFFLQSMPRHRGMTSFCNVPTERTITNAWCNGYPCELPLISIRVDKKSDCDYEPRRVYRHWLARSLESSIVTRNSRVFNLVANYESTETR